MSIRATSLVWERSRAKGSNLMMLLAIADYAKDNGRDAWPSARTLSWKTRLSPRAGEIILMALVKSGEVLPRWDSKERRLYLDVRCVCEWDAYQKDGPIPEREIFSRRQSESFSLRLVQAHHVNAKKGFPNAKKSAAQREKSGTPIRSDPSLDPSTEPKSRGFAPDASLGSVEKPSEHLAVITVLAHKLIDTLGLPHMGEVGQYIDHLKQRCADEHIAYDSDVVGKAFESALWQRQRRRQRAR